MGEINERIHRGSPKLWDRDLLKHTHDWHMLGWEMTKTRMTGNGPVTGVDPIYKATKFVCLTCKKVEEV